jgi:serine/threonine-protein kinase
MSGARHAIPPVLGRYQLLALLGEGPVARSYLAVTRTPGGWGDLAAIREIRPELAAQPHLREMFLHEARLVAGLHHPNIVKVQEIFEERGVPYLALEFVDGHRLGDLLRRVGRREMPLPLQLWMFTQMLAGLQYAHQLRDREGGSLGLVHREISPESVIVTYDGQVKLIEFGMANLVGVVAPHVDGAASAKLGYGAPEQFVSQPLDPRSDVYSVGVMLWEALAGRRRRVAENPAAIIEARVAGVEPRISEVVPDVPRPLADICDRATMPDVRARYQTAREMQQALESYLDGCWEPVDRSQLAGLMERTFALEKSSLRRCVQRQVAVLTERIERPAAGGLRGALARGWLQLRAAVSRAAAAVARVAGRGRRFAPAVFALLGSAAVIVVAASMTARPMPPRAWPRMEAKAPKIETPPPSPAPAPVATMPVPVEAPAVPVKEPDPPPPPVKEAEAEEAEAPEKPAPVAPKRARDDDDVRVVARDSDPRPRLPSARTWRPGPATPATPATSTTPATTDRRLAQWGRYARPQVWVQTQPGEDLPPRDLLPRRALDEEDPYRK